MPFALWDSAIVLYYLKVKVPNAHRETLKLMHIRISGRDGCWALTTGYGTIYDQAVLAAFAALWLWLWGLQAYQYESQAEQAACFPSVFPFLMDCRITERRPGARQLGGGCSRLPALGVSPCSSCCLALSIRGLEVWLSIFWSLLCCETNIHTLIRTFPWTEGRQRMCFLSERPGCKLLSLWCSEEQ